MRADVGVADGRIAALGDLSGYIADRRLDAAGRIVAPGFIDVHGHDDLMFVEKPDLAWKTSQGITSVVVGNCGISGAPAPLPAITRRRWPCWASRRCTPTWMRTSPRCRRSGR